MRWILKIERLSLNAQQHIWHHPVPMFFFFFLQNIELISDKCTAGETLGHNWAVSVERGPIEAGRCKKYFLKWRQQSKRFPLSALLPCSRGERRHFVSVGPVCRVSESSLCCTALGITPRMDQNTLETFYFGAHLVKTESRRMTKSIHCIHVLKKQCFGNALLDL